MTWNGNSTDMVPAGKDCFLSNRSIINKGSLLFNTYKMCGGFLGFGRGYYGGRNRNVNDLGNDTLVGADDQVKETKSWFKGNADKTESKEQAEGNSTNALISASPSCTMSCNSIITNTRLQNVISGANLSPCSLQDRQKDDITFKSRWQGSVCKKMCEEMCYRIVKEHPFIAPFLRRDLLQELHLKVTGVPEYSNSRLFCNSGCKYKRFQSYKAICQQPSSEHPVTYTNRGAQIKQRSRDFELEKNNVSSKTFNVLSRSKMDESNIYRNSFNNIDECRQIHSTGIFRSNPNFNRRLRRGRSCSLPSKSLMNNLDRESFKYRKTASENIRKSLECTRLITAHTSEDIADEGSSVDPMTTPITRRDDKFCKRKSRDCRLQISGQCDKRVGEIMLQKVPDSIKSEHVTRKEKTRPDIRMMEIMNELQSWGFPMSNKLRNKRWQPFSSAQKKLHEIVPISTETQTEEKNKLVPINPESAVLFNLFESLANSKRNREILRQITNVLNASRGPSEQPSDFNVRKVELSGHVLGRKTELTHSMTYRVPDKGKRNISSYNGTEFMSTIHKGWKKNRCGVEREASFGLRQERKLATDKMTETGDPGNCDEHPMQGAESESFPSKSLDDEHVTRPQPMVAASYRLNKNKQPPFSTKSPMKKSESTVSDKTKIEKSLISNKNPCNKDLGFQNEQIYHDNRKSPVGSDNCQELNKQVYKRESKFQSENNKKSVRNNQAGVINPKTKINKTNVENNDSTYQLLQYSVKEKSREAVAYGTTDCKNSQLKGSCFVKENETQTSIANNVESNMSNFAENPAQLPENASFLSSRKIVSEKTVPKKLFEQRNAGKQQDYRNIFPVKNISRKVTSNKNSAKRTSNSTELVKMISTRNETICIHSLHDEPSNLDFSKIQPKRASSQRNIPKISLVRKNQNIISLARNEPRNKSFVKKNTKNMLSKRNDLSDKVSVKKEIKRTVSRKHESSETSQKGEPMNETLRKIKTNNETSRKSEPNNETSRKIKPNNETSRKCELNNEASRKSEQSNEASRKSELNNEVSRNIGLYLEASRINTPNKLYLTKNYQGNLHSEKRQPKGLAAERSESKYVLSPNATRLLKSIQRIKGRSVQNLHKPASTYSYSDAGSFASVCPQKSTSRKTFSILNKCQTVCPSKENISNQGITYISPVKNADQLRHKSATQKQIKGNKSFSRIVIKRRVTNETKKQNINETHSRFHQNLNNKKLAMNKKHTSCRGKKQLNIQSLISEDGLPVPCIETETIINKMSQDDNGEQNSHILIKREEPSPSCSQKDIKDDINESNRETVTLSSSFSSNVNNIQNIESTTEDSSARIGQILECDLSEKHLSPDTIDGNVLEDNLNTGHNSMNSSLLLKKSLLDEVVKNMSSGVLTSYPSTGRPLS